MHRIELAISGGPTVIARDPSLSGRRQHGGNIGAKPGETISWQCASNGQSYLVRFFDFVSKENVWPFAEQADQTEKDPDPPPNTPNPPDIKYLKVNSMTARSLTFNYPFGVKYVVAVERPGPHVTPLDPMIIIRPSQVVEASHQATDGVMFGVTCAVVGAAAGAALTALWT